ncbi:MAG: YbaK/EbsC family protein [Methylophilaceae bacterium]|jgi:prolyl-tRNA editing enzyme YbaK/EbsC (Cys-tRNA(Pro) deacylase)|nr:YbaK/EbsC family protein [Methylophilaceae bacterium]MDG1453842.1 YbaK/EbsC family protein [Methylophilaceae bacterium]
MEPIINSAVTDLLQKQNIAFEVIEIPLSEDKKPIRNLEELFSAKGLDPTSVVRSVLFRGGSERFYLLAVAGAGRADWGFLRKQLDERQLRMAEFDEVPEVTGYVVGAVPPIALPVTLRVMVDSSLHHYETVVIGSGVLGYALSLKGADLLALLAGAEQGEFVKA